MNRLVLRALNSPILVLLTTIAIAVQSSLFAPWPLRFFQPDVALLVVIWCALRRDFLEGGVITLLVGEISELHSSVPQGVFLIAYMTVFLVLRAADKLFVLPTQIPMLKVTIASGIAWRLSTIFALLMLSGHRYLWRQMLVHVIPGAVFTAICGLWAYHALEKFDAVTFKSATAENPDEYQIENLGL